jgi:hypothetical protein
MSRGGEICDYEVVLAPAAIRFIAALRAEDQAGLCEALQLELDNGPNTDTEIHIDSSIAADASPGTQVNTAYTATPLSFGGFTAIHRALKKAEIGRLERERGPGRPIADHGFYVIDILPAESAFRRWPRLA